MTTSSSPPTKETWKKVLKSAFNLFEDLEQKGFGTPPFSLGGGTVLMFRFKHRLSKDIDFFGYDVQWLSLLSPRLNEVAAAMATDYTEQANGIKIVMPHGDIDFVISADVVIPVDRTLVTMNGRKIQIDPTSEILAKKLYYRAAHFKTRDVYDMSAAIDLDPNSARIAVQASKHRKDTLLNRLTDLSRVQENDLLNGIIPYDGQLRHAENMISKVKNFIANQRDEPGISKSLPQTQKQSSSRKKKDSGYER
jgi:hypothetical protein